MGVAVAPEELTLWLELLHFPGSEPMVALDSTFLGDEAEARKLLERTSGLPAPIADSRAVLSTADLGQITAEPTDPGPGQSRCELLTGLDDAALTALLDQPIDPLMAVQIRHLGGALVQPSESPHGSLTEPYAIYMFGVPRSPEAAEAIGRRQRDLATALPTSGRKPATFLNPTEDLSDALSTGSVRRLRRLKDDLDPRAIIRGNFQLPALSD